MTTQRLVRHPLFVVSLAALSIFGLFAATAFNAADSGARAVSAEVVGDSAAYLALERNQASPHKGFVSQANSGKLVVSFGAANADAAGDGLNPGSIYYFDDLLNITNQGTKAVLVQVQATSTTGTIHVCTATSTAAMTDGCYAASHPASPISLAVGSKLYLGLKLDASSLESGSQVAGTVKVVATRA